MSSSRGIRDGLTPGASANTTTTTTQRSTSAVRSRTRRLISFDNEEEENNNTTTSGIMQSSSSALSSGLASDRQTTRSRGGTPSPFPSRGASPLPMSHPSRVRTDPGNRGKYNNGQGASSGGFYHDGKNQFTFADSSLSRTGVDFLDASWSSLQSLASSVLGSDTARPVSNGGVRTHARKPSHPDLYMKNASRTSNTPSAWGPSAPSAPEIGAGTKEDRQAYVQAKKREALLLGDTGPSASRTRHKRRDSGDHTTHANIDPEQDEEALVYIHHVQPTDTMTSLTIRYGCQPAIFRKANGFWPSDSIQSRKTVLLPVDSCSVKGRPIRHTNTDLLGETSEDMDGSSIAPTPSPDQTSKQGVSENVSTAEIEGDRVWKPESWVQIDNFPGPVEIGRVPRMALGFFPRTRRKSIPYSDVEPSGTSTTAASTISSSASSLPDSQTPSSTTQPPNRSHAGSSGSTKPPGARHQRQRSNIQLAGPGVGTLDRSSMAPGAALDGLNKFLNQHIPTLAPPPPPPATNPDSGAFESTSTAQASTANSLDNLGGAFEGWVRKMTTRAKASFNELQQGTLQTSNGRVPSTTDSDLIELDDGLESRVNNNHLHETRAKRPDLDRVGSSTRSSSSLSMTAPGTSRSRAGGFTAGSRSSSFGDRVKDD